MAGDKQTTFGRDTVPDPGGAVQQFLETSHGEDPRARRSVMTTKQVKRAYLDRTRAPKMSKEERRRRELEELARIKREEQEAKKQREKERASAKARMLRDKKKDKEQKEKDEKRKQGLPLVAVRPSQDMITRFFRGNGTARKRDSDGTSIPPTVLEESEDAVPDEAETAETADSAPREDNYSCGRRGPGHSPTSKAGGEITDEADAPANEDVPSTEAPAAQHGSPEPYYGDGENVENRENEDIRLSHDDSGRPGELEKLAGSRDEGGSMQLKGAVHNAPDEAHGINDNDLDGEHTEPEPELKPALSHSPESGSPPCSPPEHCKAATAVAVNESPPESSVSIGSSTAGSIAAKPTPAAAANSRAAPSGPLTLNASISHIALNKRLPMPASSHPPPRAIIPSRYKVQASSAPVVARRLPDRGLAFPKPPPPCMLRGSSSNTRTSSPLSIRAVHNAARPSMLPPPPTFRDTSAVQGPRDGRVVTTPSKFMCMTSNQITGSRELSPKASYTHVRQLVSQEDEDAPPTSTQLFLITNLDDCFPSASQLDQELQLQEPMSHSPEAAIISIPVPLISSQDLVLSTQDLREMDWDTGLEEDASTPEQDPKEAEKDCTDVDTSIAQDLELFGSQLVADSDSDLSENGHASARECMQRRDGRSGHGDIEEHMASSLEQALELMAQCISDDDWEESFSGPQSMHRAGRHSQEQLI